MSHAPVILSAADRPSEGWDDPRRGNASWRTLFSADATPTGEMTAGLMEIPANGGVLRPHRHRQAEIYFVHEGAGVLTVDGVETALAAGMAAFIPGDAEHSLRNDAASALKIFYVFATGRFTDVDYRFPPA